MIQAQPIRTLQLPVTGLTMDTCPQPANESLPWDRCWNAERRRFSPGAAPCPREERADLSGANTEEA